VLYAATRGPLPLPWMGVHVGVAFHSVGIAASSAALCQTTTHDKTYDTQSFVGHGNYDDPRLKMSHEGKALV